jgi:hypothetical protein
MLCLRASSRAITSALSILSSLLLIAAFSFQTDYGDGAGYWFAITALVNSYAYDIATVPSWWPLRSAIAGLLLFLPVAICWFLTVLTVKPSSPPPAQE